MSEFEQHEYNGICNICGWSGTFKRAHRAIRETYSCGGCKSSLRYRVQAEAVLSCYKDLGVDTIKALVAMEGFSKLHIFEPGIAGPFRPHFRGLPNYQLSFYWGDLASGERRDGITCQDLMKLAIPDSSIDLMITSDIFEHVRLPFDAFREIQRVLKPGGFHVFTIPTAYPLPAETVKRVNVDGPEDVPILEPVYHGDGKGGRSIVYNDFGQDLLRDLGNLGLMTAIHNYQTKERIVRTASALISVKVGSGWLFGAGT